jgi:hypothetical protein
MEIGITTQDAERHNKDFPAQVQMRYAHLEINGKKYIKVTTEISELKPVNYFKAILESEAKEITKKAK